jgi:ribonuclease-3
MSGDIKKLQERINHKFNDLSLLKQALSHPSSKRNKSDRDYERLEFLGDSILGFIISEMLYNSFPDEKEGALAKRRSGIVCRSALAKVAREIGLGEYMVLGNGEDQTGGRENNANLENVMEALVAAVYLDSGVDEARKLVDGFFSKHLNKMKNPPKDPKSELQEKLQARGYNLPEYKIKSMQGPSHEPQIEVELKVDDKHVTAVASSKKQAEKQAAEEMLSIIKDNSKK